MEDSPPYPSAPMEKFRNLHSSTAPQSGQAFPVSTHGVMLGRDPSSCDFVFPSNAKGISRNHCKLQFNPQTQMFVLYDLGSSFGTYLGSGIQVPQGQPAALRAGDEFYLATRANVFRVSL